MGKKKAIKLATATAIAASAFVAVAPTQSEAATSSVDKAITQASSAMLKAFNTYNKTARVDGKLPTLSTIKKDVKSAQDAYTAATKEIASKGGTKAQKAKLTTKLNTNKKYLDRAELYLKAVTTNLNPTKTAFTEAVAGGTQSKVLSTQKAYKAKIKEFEANVKKVYGPDARELLTAKYADTANELANSVNEEMEVYEAYKKISGLVGTDLEAAYKGIQDTNKAADNVAKLDSKLAKNITNAVVKINAKFEKAVQDAVSIEGITDGEKTEEETKTITVKATKGSEIEVTLNGTAVAANENGSYTLKLKEGSNKVAVSSTVYGVKTELNKEIISNQTPAVKSVSAINSKQVLVKFNKSVGVGASTVANYEVKSVANGSANVVKSAVVQKDGKSVLLTLTSGYRVSTDIQVAVSGINVEDSIKDTFPKFSTVINVNDTVAPEVVSVSASTGTNAAQVATVKLSEPVKPGAVFKINGTTVTASAVGTPADATVYTIDGLNLDADKAHTLEIIGLEDNAENAVTLVTKTFSVTKDTTVATGKAVTVQDNKVQVTFDKAVVKSTLANVDILRYDDAAKSYVPVALDATTSITQDDASGKVFTFHLASAEAGNFFAANDNKEELIVKVKSGVIDTAGNQVQTFEEKITATQDVSGPELQNVTFDKNSKGEVTKLYFNFNELLGALTTISGSNISVTDLSTNKAVTFADIFGAASTAAVAPDGKTVIVSVDSTATNKLENGQYSFEVQPALVKDASFAQNFNKKVAKTVNFGTVTNEVTASATATALNVVTVNFSKAVTNSALTPANYAVNGKALPSDTVITKDSDTQVTFTLPVGTVAKSDSKAIFTVNNVKAQDSSATFKNYVGVISVVDNTRPVGTGSILANGLGKITFSEAIATGLSAGTIKTDLPTVKVNGLVLDASTTTYATATELDGTDAITLSVSAAIEDGDQTQSEYDYLYIDVDGNSAFDLTKDIVLERSASDKANLTVANGGWDGITTADLNKVNSVEVIAHTTVVSIKDKSTLANTLAPKASIKLK